MPRFVVPTPHQIRSILRDTHATWGAGLSMSDYVTMWEELGESSWGRSWFTWRALEDNEGRVVSSLKLYRPMLRVGETSGRAAAIGAVFTPRPLRRLGHAAALIRACLDEAGRRGDPWALLFTDIGTDYYRALGFTPLPCEDAVGTLPSSAARASSGISLRAMTPDDLGAVAAAHDAAAAGLPIAVLRDRNHWEFLLVRAASFFRRLDGSGLDRRFMIATDSSRPIGYLVAVMGPGEWNLREAASFDGDAATLARILAAGAADASRAGATTVWGWIPRDLWPRVPGWHLHAQPRLRAIPMIRSVDGSRLPERLRSVEGAFIPYLDQF